jgi:hypothetical protein
MRAKSDHIRDKNRVRRGGVPLRLDQFAGVLAVNDRGALATAHEVTILMSRSATGTVPRARSLRTGRRPRSRRRDARRALEP